MRSVPPACLTTLVVCGSFLMAGCGGATMSNSSASRDPLSASRRQSRLCCTHSRRQFKSDSATRQLVGSGPSSPPSTNPAPAQPAGTTISDIEQMPGWESCDLCSGGGKVSYSMGQSLNYPQPGSTQFSLGQGTPWAHALWWKRLGNDPNASHFVFVLDQYIEHPEASFGIEYDVNQIVGSSWYDFAIQCSFG